MSETTTTEAPAPAPAPVYHAFIGLRDSVGKGDRKFLEMAVVANTSMEHNQDDPHMVVLQYLRRHWDRIVAAAEIEYTQATAEAMRDRMDAAGGAVNAATLKH